MTDCVPITVPGASPRRADTALVLEDALIVAYDAAEMLAELGVGQVTTCGTLSEALSALQGGFVPALALLDIDLGGETSLEAAIALSQMQVPILYSTGYEIGESGIRDFPAGLLLPKPYTSEDISNALNTLGFSAP